MTERSRYKKMNKMKGGDCGCNANHAIGPAMTGGSGFLNSATYTNGSIPDTSYYQYNQSLGTATDPNSTGIGGNLISSRNLDNMSSMAGGRSRKRKNKRAKKAKRRTNRKNCKGGSRRYRKKGGNTGMLSNELMNTKISNYMTTPVNISDNLHTTKGGSNYTSINDYITDKTPYIFTKGGRKTKRMSGGVLPYSLFNQMTNPITAFGTTMGASNNASIMSGQGQPGDSAGYNQPAANNSGYNSANPYLI